MISKRSMIPLGVFAGSVGLAACSGLLGLDGAQYRGAPDATSSDSAGDAVRGDVGTPNEASLEAASPTDAGIAEAATADVVVDPCASDAGPTMVLVPALTGQPAFCIDSTEVLASEYEEGFIAAIRDGYVPQLPSACSWKNAVGGANCFESGANSACMNAFPETDFNLPAEVDWCDAYAFCAWSGKRLCRERDEDAGLPTGSPRTSYMDEWYAACADNAAAPNYVPTTIGNCVISTTLTMPIDEDAGCSTPLGGGAGLVDILGNAAEWVDSCDFSSPDAGEMTPCLVRGGDYGTKANDDMGCGTALILRMNNVGNFVGIRCCRDVAP